MRKLYTPPSALTSGLLKNKACIYRAHLSEKFVSIEVHHFFLKHYSSVREVKTSHTNRFGEKIKLLQYRMETPMALGTQREPCEEKNGPVPTILS